jgi:hypothetical protein
MSSASVYARERAPITMQLRVRAEDLAHAGRADVRVFADPQRWKWQGRIRRAERPLRTASEAPHERAPSVTVSRKSPAKTSRKCPTSDPRTYRISNQLLMLPACGSAILREDLAQGGGERVRVALHAEFASPRWWASMLS